MFEDDRLIILIETLQRARRAERVYVGLKHIKDNIIFNKQERDLMDEDFKERALNHIYEVILSSIGLIEGKE